MTKTLALLLAASILALSLTACAAKPDSFSVKVVCESDDVYQIFYSCYFGDEYYGMGGMADYDKNELTEETALDITFTRAYFENRDDLSDFSLDFSPYGKDDEHEIGKTNRVYIPAEYGGKYTVVFSGDKDNGFTAELRKGA